MKEKIYTCECGRTFTEPNRFNGHKSNCKIHHQYKGTLDLYEEKRIKSKNDILKASKVRVEKEEQIKKNALQIWIAEQHTCEKCGKVMTEKFGSGRFCSRACANSRNFSNESILKKSLQAKGRKGYIDSKNNIHYYKNDDNRVTECTKLKKEKVSKRDVNVCKSLKRLVEQYKSLIENHNAEILRDYEKLLKDKTIGKDSFITNNQFVYAKYASTTQEHLRAHGGHVFIHILLAEKLLDRYLTKEEIVHHKDLDKLNNSLSNIYIFNNKASHSRFHQAKIYWLSIKDDVLVCDKITKDLLILNGVIK